MAKRTVLACLLMPWLLLCACGSDQEIKSQSVASTEPAAPGTAAGQEILDPHFFKTKDGRVILTPTPKAPQQFQRHPITGRTVFRAFPIQQLLRYAYDIDPREIVLEVSVDQTTYYDVIIEPPDRNLDTARKMLQKRLETEFNIEARGEDRTVPVLLMQRTTEKGPPLPPASHPRRVIGGLGHFEGRGASLEDLMRFTRTFSERPIVDQTQLSGSYDIVMKWDPEGGREAFLEALRKQGLELVPGTAPVAHLVIQRPTATPATP